MMIRFRKKMPEKVRKRPTEWKWTNKRREAHAWMKQMPNGYLQAFSNEWFGKRINDNIKFLEMISVDGALRWWWCNSNSTSFQSRLRFESKQSKVNKYKNTMVERKWVLHRSHCLCFLFIHSFIHSFIHARFISSIWGHRYAGALLSFLPHFYACFFLAFFSIQITTFVFIFHSIPFGRYFSLQSIRSNIHSREIENVPTTLLTCTPLFTNLSCKLLYISLVLQWNMR